MTVTKQFRARLDDLLVLADGAVVLAGKASTSQTSPVRPKNCWLEIDGQRGERVTVIGVEIREPRFVLGPDGVPMLPPGWDPLAFGVLTRPAPTLTRDDLQKHDVWLVCEEDATDG